MFKLHQMHESGNCYKVRLVMSLLAIDYETVEVDILKGGSRTTEFLTKNLNGRVPTLETEQGFLPESNAILWYLAEGTWLMPTDKFAQAQVLQWLFFEQYSHEPYIATIRFWVSLLREPEKYRDEIAVRKPRGEAALQVMDQHLSAVEYMVGGQYSIADIALYAYTHVAHEGGFDLDPYPALGRWLKRVESQPGHITIGEHRG